MIRLISLGGLGSKRESRYSAVQSQQQEPSRLSLGYLDGPCQVPRLGPQSKQVPHHRTVAGCLQLPGLGYLIRPVSESHTRFTRFLLLLRDRRVSWKVISPSLMSAPSFWRSHASHANRLYLHTCSVPSRAVGHAVLSFAARPLAPIYPPRPGADWHYLLLAILPISS